MTDVLTKYSEKCQNSEIDSKNQLIHTLRSYNKEKEKTIVELEVKLAESEEKIKSLSVKVEESKRPSQLNVMSQKSNQNYQDLDNKNLRLIEEKYETILSDLKSDQRKEMEGLKHEIMKLEQHNKRCVTDLELKLAKQEERNKSLILQNAEIVKRIEEVEKLHVTKDNGQKSQQEQDRDGSKNSLLTDQKTSRNDTKDRHEKVLFNSKQNKELSNFYRCNLEINNIKYTSSEQAYQAEKARFHNQSAICNLIMKETSPFIIKSLSDNITTSNEWHDKKVEIMKEIISHKFKQCKQFRQKLLANKGKELIEDVPDVFWGKGTREQPGKNMLGTLMNQLQHDEGNHMEETVTQTSEPTVRIIGDSQVQHINPERVAGMNIIKPTLAYNFDECLKAVKEIPSESVDVDNVVIQCTVNEAKRSSENDCIQKCKRVITELRKKCDKSKIIISGPIPDINGNEREVWVFNRMRRELRNIDNNLVFLTNHSRFVDRGGWPLEHLYRDSIHPSSQGINIIVANMKKTCLYQG